MIWDFFKSGPLFRKRGPQRRKCIYIQFTMYKYTVFGSLVVPWWTDADASGTAAVGVVQDKT